VRDKPTSQLSEESARIAKAAGIVLLPRKR
jgi:hypothetical protein